MFVYLSNVVCVELSDEQRRRVEKRFLQLNSYFVVILVSALISPFSGLTALVLPRFYHARRKNHMSYT